VVQTGVKSAGWLNRMPTVAEPGAEGNDTLGVGGEVGSGVAQAECHIGVLWWLCGGVGGSDLARLRTADAPVDHARAPARPAWAVLVGRRRWNAAAEGSTVIPAARTSTSDLTASLAGRAVGRTALTLPASISQSPANRAAQARMSAA
jgi:hypothetical protein